MEFERITRVPCRTGSPYRCESFLPAAEGTVSYRGRVDYLPNFLVIVIIHHPSSIHATLPLIQVILALVIFCFVVE